MKKNFFKIINKTILVVSIFIFSGCSQSKKNNDSLNDQQAFIRQDVDNFILNISEAKTAKINNDENKIIFTIDIENNNSQTKDVGSIDFYLESEDKKYDIDANSNNFGEPVEPGKKLRKNLTFIIPENLTKVKLVYKPTDKVLASWELTIPSPNE